MLPSYFWYAINACYADLIKKKSENSPRFCRDAYNFISGEYLDSDWLFTTANSILDFAIDKTIVDSFVHYLKTAQRVSADEAFDGFNIPNTQSLYSFWLYRDATWIGTDGNLVVDHTVLLYVGMTSNLSQRLKQHHRMDEIKFLLDCGFEVDLVYLSETEMMKFRMLHKTERDFIQNFYPIMNGSIRNIEAEIDPIGYLPSLV
jgi:hypothetical protein